MVREGLGGWWGRDWVGWWGGKGLDKDYIRRHFFYLVLVVGRLLLLVEGLHERMGIYICNIG